MDYGANKEVTSAYQSPHSGPYQSNQRRAASRLPFFFALYHANNSFRAHPRDSASMLRRAWASGEPVPASATPSDAQQVTREACRDKGLPIFTPPPANPGGPKRRFGQFAACLGRVPARLEREGSTGPSHLSSDPRVNTARALIGRNRFAEALEILRPLAPDHPDQTDVRFLLGLAASRCVSEEAGLDDEERQALLDEAIAAFRSILIHRPGAWCACAWNWAWPSI